MQSYESNYAENFSIAESSCEKSHEEAAKLRGILARRALRSSQLPKSLQAISCERAKTNGSPMGFKLKESLLGIKRESVGNRKESFEGPFLSVAKSWNDDERERDTPF